jgi:hypothetical protein
LYPPPPAASSALLAAMGLLSAPVAGASILVSEAGAAEQVCGVLEDSLSAANPEN